MRLWPIETYWMAALKAMAHVVAGATGGSQQMPFSSVADVDHAALGCCCKLCDLESTLREACLGGTMKATLAVQSSTGKKHRSNPL